LTWLNGIFTEELWEEEQFQGGYLLSDYNLYRLQTVWNHLSNHIGQNQQVTGNTIRSWCISLTQANNTFSTCRVRKQATCTTCGQPRCGYTFCNGSKESCHTYHELTIPTPNPAPGTNIPSANMHQMGEHFVEVITGIGSNPSRNAMDVRQNKPPI